MPTILVADDDVSIGTVLGRALKGAGYASRITPKGEMLKEWVKEGAGDLVVVDVLMPDSNGLEIVAFIQQTRPDLPVIVISAQSTFITAMKATQAGAFDYFPKPFDLAELLQSIGRALATQQDIEKKAKTYLPGEETLGLPLVGSSVAMQEIYRAIARLSNSDMSVLIMGESGTGKAVIARILHDYSKHAGKAFVSFNLSALPRENIEKELFGYISYEEGTPIEHQGMFAKAEGGTLFLDEIGDIPLHVQGRLLRVLHDGAYRPVGGQKTYKVNLRLISSTQYDIRKFIEQGVFREDLFYTINVVPLRLPPLKERLGDIPELAQHFLLKGNKLGHYGYKYFTKSALEELQRHSWPGNVRELENFIGRMGALYPQSELSKDNVAQELWHSELWHGEGVMNEKQTPPHKNQSSTPEDSMGKETLESFVTKRVKHYLDQLGEDSIKSNIYALFIAEVEKPLITMALNYTKGNQIKAAAILGLNRNTLRKKIRDLKIAVLRNLS
ncbi:sigma 54-interacting transcriptional regulator [Entomobacter blattae]|uniref:DNA-binding transcriptional regulator NtrC n=1 Tax=Entomobacter blattae TaxID=2762277 RepID=A0A7H1NT57_9PROT|nr:sigma 54-interacting transcriptional regulator [Entomobacter blattae]QNT78967.1 DNA-binding transcriptional regulator NtrC [Entomobacter blattae]